MAELKSVNEDLLDRIMELEQQNRNLENALVKHLSDSTELNSIRNLSDTDYEIFKARVINNSLNLVDNYITLNRGSKDGIRPEMGVVDGNGVVGISIFPLQVTEILTTHNFTTNAGFAVQHRNHPGIVRRSFIYDARYAYLKDLPRHAEFNLGDTVVTSGYSTVFPEGIMIGTVDDMADSNDGLSYLLKVKLATDFGKVSEVRVIARTGQREQKELEQKSLAQ